MTLFATLAALATLNTNKLLGYKLRVQLALYTVQLLSLACARITSAGEHTGTYNFS